jgi:hypothetical protein
VTDQVARAITELYRVSLNAFTRERNTRAAALKKAGQPAAAQAVRELKRPGAALWAVNQLAHHEARDLGAFVETVQEMRRTQLRDPRAAGALVQRQRAELDALVDRASARLDRATPATRRRIADILLGAAVERDHARELLAGRLTVELSAPGFEALLGAPRAHLRSVGGREAPPAAPRPAAKASPVASDEQRRAMREERRRHVEALEQVASSREAAATEAQRELDELAERLAAARKRLSVVRNEAARATTASRVARRTLDS